jgi:hypothetical protein
MTGELEDLPAIPGTDSDVSERDQRSPGVNETLLSEESRAFEYCRLCKTYFPLARVRMYFTKASIWSLLSRVPKAGIFPRP